MKANCKEIAELFLEPMYEDKRFDKYIDSSDRHVKVIAEDKCSFELQKSIENSTKTDRWGQAPLGLIVYTITIESKYIPFDDEE